MDYRNICNNIDVAYGCRIAKELSLIGNDNSPLGFRNAGSTGELKAAEYIENEMRNIGLDNISSYPFEVDSWEFRSAAVTYYNTCGERISYPLSAFAGTKGTEEPIQARIVNVGYGTYEDCNKVDLKGAIAFIKLNLIKDYWLGQPAYQLELAGALAVIVMLEGSHFGDCETVLNSGDSISRPNIPIVNISRENGKKLIKALDDGGIYGELNIDCILSKGESRNITGDIIGEKEEEYILLGGHYDGYFKSYIDDAFAIGISLAIAKSIIDSGKKPKHTIKIIAHGAEEFGVCDSHCDWCIGSWQQINNIMPCWADQIKLFLNIDAVNPDANEFLVQTSPELYGFMKKHMTGIADYVNEYWKAGYLINDVNGPWSDDFSYYMAGIPVAICGRGKSEWRRKYYHTNKDTCENLQEILLEKVAYIYMSFIYAFDTKNISDIKFSEEIQTFCNSIDKSLFTNEGISLDELNIVLRKLEIIFNDLNSSNVYLSSEVRGMIIKSIRGLNFNDELIYKLDEVQKNIKIIYKIKEYIQNQDYEKTKAEINNFLGSGIINDFNDKVYEYWCIKSLISDEAKLQWGKNLIEPPVDIRRLYKMICNRESSQKILRELEHIKKEEVEKAEKHIKRIEKTISRVITLITGND